MTSTERVHAPLAADERATLLGFLDSQRSMLRIKTEGLDAEQLARTLPPSDLTLGGMLKHLAYVEQWWFTQVFRGQAPTEPWASVDWAADEDWDWHSAAEDTPEQLRALLDAEIAVADQVIAGASLDDLAERPGRRGTPSMRWILLHMVEEYARHLGHADLIRESIDGSTGA